MNKIYAVFDLETTGGSPKQEKIIEIAIVKFDGEKIIDQYQTLINPKKNIPPYVARLTGISNKMVSEAPTFDKVAAHVKAYTKNCIMVAHNVKSDYAFLKHEFKELGIYFKISHICTIKLTKKLYPTLTKVNLGFLTETFNIKLTNAHRAINDCLATVELFKKYLDEASDDLIEELLDFTKNKSILKLKFGKEELLKIPDETGVLIFKNEMGKIIYVSKSINLKGLVEEMIFNYTNKTYKSYVLSKTQKLEFVTTGSELLANLIEIDYIFRFKPTYNKKQYRVSSLRKIESKINSNGYSELNILPAQLSEENIGKFGNKYLALKTLDGIIKEFKLCNNLTSKKTKIKNNTCEYENSNYCNGACLQKEDTTTYNLRVSKAIESYQYLKNFVIIDEGTDLNNLLLIKVQNNICTGYQFFDNASFEEKNIENLKLENTLVNHPEILNTIVRFSKEKKVKNTIELKPNV